MVSTLKFQVEKVFGQKISGRGAAELLSEDIYLKTNAMVSYNTIRRLFGLVAFTKPRNSTLDALSCYCGFVNYKDFCKRFADVDYWPVWEGLFLSLSNLSYDELLLHLKRRKNDYQDFGVAFATAVKELIGMNRHPEVLRLFGEPDFQFANLHFDQVSQIGVIVNMYFRNANHPKLERALLQNKNFLDLVVKSNIDYTQFKFKYGKWISFLEKQSHLDTETATFVYCIRPFMYIINNQSIPRRIRDKIPALCSSQHPILFGRIFCLKFILSKDATQRAHYIDSMQARMQAQPDRCIELLYLPAVHSLLTKEKQLADFTATALTELPHIFHWYQISLLGIEEVFLASRLIAIKDFTAARALLANNPIEKIRFGYKTIMDILITFFLIKIAEHFNEDTTLLHVQLQSKLQKTDFPLFNSAFFATYFN